MVQIDLESGEDVDLCSSSTPNMAMVPVRFELPSIAWYGER